MADDASRGTSPAGQALALYPEIGRRIQAVRRERGMTQAALASLVGLTRASVVNIERGRQKFLVHTLIQMARALGVTTSELLAEADVPPGPPLEALLEGRAPAEQAWIRSAIGINPRRETSKNGRSKKANS